MGATLKLSEATERLENSTKDTLSWQAELRAAMFDAIGPQDVAEIVQKQVALAKEGKESAIKFVFAHVLGTTTPVKLQQTTLITDVETAARIAKDRSA